MSQDDHAILIGIKSYPTLGENSTNADLQGPENDIAAVKEWLLDPKGGALHPSGATIHEVRAIAGASNRMGPDSETLEEDVLGKLEKLAQTNPNGRRVGRRLYFYLSGHGFSPGRQRGCLYTPNATAKRGYNIHATGWLSLLQDSGYFSEYVLWMDCCMNRVTLLPPGEPRTRLMVSSESPRASFIAFAARRSLKAVEMPIGVGGAYHGLFTATLLDGLRGAAADSNGKVTGHSLADWIRNAMSARMTESELNDVDISKEPEVVQEDKSLVFVRGVTKPSFSIEVSFPAYAAGETARLWSGSVPRIVREWQIGSAPEPLSIQAHPNQEQARRGWARENAEGIPLDAPHRNYRDPNHKPELVCALSDPFVALKGFRPVDEAARRLEAVAGPELKPEIARAARERSAPALRALFARLLTLDAEERQPVLARAAAEARRRGEDLAWAWVGRLLERYPGDAGALAPLYLNLVTLGPGDALYLPAGELHAYLQGTALEIMANSDNVLRGGLTPKHVDAPELLATLVFEPRGPEVLGAVEVAPGERVYRTPAREFELGIVDVSGERPFRPAAGRGVEILLGLEGQPTVAAEDASAVLERGVAVLVPAATPTYAIEGVGRVARARVPA